MRCCVPFCENISNLEVSKCDGISFHVFPDDPHLRAAWLMALDIQHTPLPDSAVICSQHFLCDDICVTDGGLRQLSSKTVPSAVQVCMICLDTDSKMFPMNKYKLDEAYEILTGYPLCNGGNLKQTLCVQCAQRLRNFSRFRDLSLRARFLIMNLVARHELITKQHIKMVNSASDPLKNNLVLTTLGPDHCDLHILEHSEDTQPTIEETGAVVKHECSDDSLSVDQEETINEDYNTQESHVSMHQHGDDRFAQSYSTVASSSATNMKNDGDTNQLSERALVDSAVLDDRAHDSMYGTRTSLKHCVVKLYDVMKYPKNDAPKQEELLTQKRQAVKSCDTLHAHTAREDGQCRAASEGEVAATHNEPATSKLCDMRPCSSAVIPRVVTFTCDVCKRVFTKKYLLVNHMRTHTGEKPFACKLCEYKCAQSSSLTRHIRSHTGEKPFSCKLCEYKFARKTRLTRHMRTHSGEKPFSCKFCEYKCAERYNLTRHMRTHFGEKRFS